MVKPGQVVKVKVLDIDVPRNRISLTLRLADPLPQAGASSRAKSAGGAKSAAPKRTQESNSGGGALAAALAKAAERRKNP